MDSNTQTQSDLVLVDSHAHSYPVYHLGKFLEAAFANFCCLGKRYVAITPQSDDGPQVLRMRFVVCITEQPGTQQFGRLVEYLASQPEGLIVRSSEGFVEVSDSDAKITLISGAQYRAAEGFEVLSPVISGVSRDDAPALAIVEQIIAAGGVPVLPWSFGKWLGARGVRFSQLVAEMCHRGIPTILGDIPLRRCRKELNAAYPGTRVVAGSDPLPWRGEERGVARLVSVGRVPWDDNNPISSVASLLRHSPVVTCGSRDLLPVAAYRLLRSLA